MNSDSDRKTNHSPASPIDKNRPGNKSRRLLLKLMGLGAGLSASNGIKAGGKWLAEDLLSVSSLLNDSVSISLYRAQDLLELELVFFGFKVSTDGKRLERSASPNLLIVYTQPQSLAEQAYEEKGGSDGGANFDAVAGKAVGDKTAMGQESLAFPAKTFLSGKSRLVFEIPSSITSIALNAKVLLEWSKFRPVINNRAASASLMPVFSIRDNIAEFDNILINKNINSNNPRVVTPIINNNQPVNRQPIRILENRPDTTRRLQINRDLRAATKDEQKVIENREVPPQVVRTDVNITNNANNTNILGVIQNLVIGKTPRPVDANETCIEMPYRLFISPNQYGAWHHEYQLKLREDEKTTDIKTYELWHSRLVCVNCDKEIDLTDATKSLRTVRALWGVDVNGKYTEKPLRDSSFKTALYNDDRHCIVHESSNWGITNFTPKPVLVHQLMLSALGAWFDAELEVKRKELEDANIIGSLNLLKWKHIATLARDHYVEVVYAGNMYPLGHQASLVRITERKPQNNYAVNRQRYFIVVTEEEKKYNPYNPNNGNFKSFPYSTIRFITTVTPTIDPPARFCNDLDDLQPDHQFVPKAGGNEIRFKLMAYDLDGNEVDFEMPLVFVSTDVSYLPTGGYALANIGKLNTCYNSKGIVNNKVGLRNQKMSLARSDTPGDTQFEVQTITFNGHGTLDESPGFRPECTELEIYIAAVENLLGKRSAQRVKLIDDETNKPEAQRANKGKVFAQLINNLKVDFNGSGNKTGGSLSPNFSITSLSKSLGAVGGDINQLKNLNFDPSSFFDNTAKLFGVIELGKIIKAISNATALVNGATVQSPIPALKNIETADAFITQYVWNAASLTAHDFGFVKFKPKTEAAGKVKVETNLYRYKSSSMPAALTVDSHLDDFAVEIAGIAALDFKRFGFKTGSNAKVEVSIDMADQPLKFLGPLSFVNDLQKYIPAGGFSDPPFLDVTASGVTTGYTLALPNIQLGAFTLSHVSLGAKINLPFTGEPLSLRFNFCEKQQPFTLTVSALGGGGFLALEFDMHGLRSLEAALEFGAAASINLGVASGAVSIMGGVYFKMTMTGGEKSYEIEGYVRINGALSVLGLITASVEFMLSLTADLSGDKVKRVWGEASLKIKIEFFMFSKTVSLKTQREFAGAGADPTFSMMISEDEWGRYCDSFAA